MAMAIASRVVIFLHKTSTGKEHGQKINLKEQGLNLKP